MDIFHILAAILDKPNAPKFYRELRDYYKNNGMLNNASAVDYLIESRFKKKDDIPTNDSDNNKK